MNSTQSPSTTPPLTPDLASHPNTSQPNDGRLPTPPPPPARPTLADLNPPTTPTPDRTVLPNVSAPPDHHTGPRASFDSIGTQEVEELAEPVENLGKTYAELSRADIRKDPILSRLAKSQGKNIDSPYDSKVAPVSFKARPAPATTGRAAGPRLSKAAALRMGTWTPAPVPAPDPAQKEAKDTLRAGHKTRPSMNIASLAAPPVAPRQNRSALLRTGSATPTASIARKTAEQVLEERKARALEEKEKRRQSVAMPTSLSAPVIAVRMNRSAALRTAPGTMGPPVLPIKRNTALQGTTSNNVDSANKDGENKDALALKRRSTIGPLKSLGAPSITPRLNRTTLLRTNTDTSQLATTSSLTNLTKTISRPSLLTRPTQSSLAKSATLSKVSESAPQSTISGQGQAMATAISGAPAFDAKGAMGTGPKQTRASLLRAGMGAKVLSSR